MQSLNQQSAEHEDQHQQDLNEKECPELSQDRDPGRNREGVVDFMDSPVSFPPDKLSGTETDEDEEEKHEEIPEGFEHLMGRWVGLCAPN